MKNQTLVTNMTVLTPAKYGINEKKKKELDLLTIQVQDAENNVTQLQAIVDSLTQKSATFQAFLSAADANRAQALSNKNLVDSVVQTANDLVENSQIAFTEMVLAKEKSEAVAENVNSVIGKLIYSAESINRLANLIVRKKAQNPLISDELVSTITTAGTDANNAVALTLVALKSAFAAQATSQESEAACTLEYTQSITLADTLSVDKETKNATSQCIQKMLDGAYTTAKEDYERAQDANNKTLKQLNQKTVELNKAQIQLRSLQLGLAAANAAALAS
ncbi:MAG: hypothetical protein HYZ14_07335 [Bacteroidetes bacterium]|nr:hypothetical protein [Bacteroidota bacterium]